VGCTTTSEVEVPNIDDARLTLARLTARNVEIARLLERLRAGRSSDETRARDSALQREFDANEEIIKRLTQEMRDAA
jgi:hypothetical protein